MTKPRKYSGGTEFGMWLRNQKAIDSSKGYLATDIDWLWLNTRTGQSMILEEKRFMNEPAQWQRGVLSWLHKLLKKDEGFCGAHLLQFEHSGPQDGAIYIDKEKVTELELLRFLFYMDRRRT
jgi:hypothetical protein